MSSNIKTEIKELRNLFEKEIISKLESIDNNIEVLVQKILGKENQEAAIKELEKEAGIIRI